MFQLNSKIQNLNTADTVNKLLCQVDTWLSDQALSRLNGDRFGAKVCLNLDDYELVTKYREILYDKGLGSPCLRDYLLEDIISRIKQLINRN